MIHFNFRNSKNQVALLAAVIYFIQGALGISAVAVPIYFRRLGWSIADITVVSSLTSLPWVFKVFYGFLSDSFPIAGYRRKSYLFFYLLCSILGWCAFAFWGTDKKSIVFALWVANLGFAGTDVITDGLVVEHSDSEWGRIYQSVSWGFRSLGSIVTGLLGGWLVLHFDPRVIFLITAFLPLLALPFVCILAEQPYLKTHLSLDRQAQLKTIARFCLTRQNLFFILFLAASSSSVLFGTPFFFYMKEKLFFKDDYLGFLISLGWAGAAIGSVVFLLWMKKVSMKKLFYAVVFLNALNVLSTYAVRGVDSAAWLVFVGGIVAGMMLLPLMAGAAVVTAGTGVEGTLFALLMGLYNLAQIAWGFLGGKWLPFFGIWGLVALATVIQLSAFLLIPHMDTKKFETPASSD